MVIHSQHLGENVVETGVGEQEALFEYLTNNFSTTPFNEAETDVTQDQRIQNLGLDGVEDTVLDSLKNVIDGTSGDDTLVGTDEDDVINAGDGFDDVDAGEGDDEVFGGEGEDYIRGDDGDDFIDAGEGDDKVNGERGNDHILGGAGRDLLFGGKGNDVIEAGEGRDFVFSGSGDDILKGEEGNDILWGNRGNDVIYGGIGNDNINGEDDDDTIFGEEGDDDITGSQGDDYIDGGEGVDTVDYSGDKAVNVNLLAGSATVSGDIEGSFTTEAPMATGVNGYKVVPVLTVGETIEGTQGQLNAATAGDYTPVGVLDGLGAVELNDSTVRVFANHELLHFRGNNYEVSDGQGGTFELKGARISYFDIDKDTKAIIDAGIAYNTIVDANGNIATDASFLPESFATSFGGTAGSGSELLGFSRFCSAVLHTAGEFDGRGIVDDIYFAGEEDGNGFSSVGGAEWAIDIKTGVIYQIPAMGRGAWENVTQIDTGTDTHVAFILSDDTSPFDADDFAAEGDANDTDREAAPLFMYVGEKDSTDPSDFLARNGLKDGKLYVWVSNTNETLPSEFNGAGNSLDGAWVEIDNSQNLAEASEDGSTGYDEYGYPTQRTLWSRAEDLGTFGFSRPEDVAYNPNDATEFVLASTGVDTFDIDPNTGNGVDTFGTMYTMKVDFTNIEAPTGALKIIYDGDEDQSRALRSPDNLDWADDGFIYVQEDEAEEDTASGDEVLFGDGAANPNEAGIVKIDPVTGDVTRVANINRKAVIDPTIDNPTEAVDTDLGRAGEWESSGILDVSTLFGEEPGTLFIFDIQAHGIEDQNNFNSGSRINDGDLVEGGQLAFLAAPGVNVSPNIDVDRLENIENIIGSDRDDVIVGNEADNTFEGGKGNDVLIGGAGVDYLTGDEGSDTFVVTTESGTDIILDFEIDSDLLDITAFGFDSVDSAKDKALQDGDNTVFTLEGGNTVVLEDVDLEELDENNVLISDPAIV